MSLKNKIYELIRYSYPSTVHKGKILVKSIDWGYETETAGRRCRDLVAEGLIEPLKDEKGRRTYRYIPTRIGIQVPPVVKQNKLFEIRIKGDI
jgi:hypothetical protein